MQRSGIGRPGWLTCFFVLALYAGNAYANWEPGSKSWKPDATALRGLATETKFDRYAIRPPADFSLTKNESGGLHAYLWKSGPRSIAPPTALAVLIGTPPAKEQALSLEKSLENGLAGLKRSQQKQFSGWKQSAIERGTVNGKPFVRARFSATLIGPNQPMKGFMYLTKDGASSIVFMWQDMGEGIKQSEPVCEAAVLTFRILKQ